jgi:hypothetical protein
LTLFWQKKGREIFVTLISQTLLEYSLSSLFIFDLTLPSGHWIMSPPPPSDVAEDDDQTPTCLFAISLRDRSHALPYSTTKWWIRDPPSLTINSPHRQHRIEASRSDDQTL